MSPDNKKSFPIHLPEMMQSYLEASQDCISLISTGGTVEYCNPAHKQIFGYDPGEMEGLHFKKLPYLQKNHIADFDSLFRKLLSGEQIEILENPVTRKDGVRIWVETSATLLHKDGKPVAIQSVSRDITERKRTEQETQLRLMFEQIVTNISGRFLNMPDHLIDKGIRRTLKEVCEFIGAVRGGVFLLSEDSKKLTLVHEWCSEPSLCRESLIRNFPVEGFDYNTGKLLNQEDVVLDSIEELPPAALAEREWYEKHGFHPIFFVPVVSEDKLTGALGFSADAKENHRWPRQYSYLLRFIAVVFYNALSRKDMSQKLRLTQFTLDRYSEPVFWLSSPDYRVLEVNPSACKSLGYTREELLRMSIYDFDPLYMDKNGALHKELQEKKSRTFESLHRRKDGREFPVEITANLIEFEGQEIVVAFPRDISARKAADEQLRRSEQEYRKIFENVNNVFYEASLDGKLLNVTPSVERVTKYKRNDLLGKPMEIFYYDPSVRGPLLKSLHEKGEVLDFEMDVKDKDGSPIPFSLNTKLIFTEDGKPERIVGSLTDMRHRKAAEKEVRQLSTALQQSPVSVIITDPDTRILYVNDSFTRFSGMKPKEILGSTPFEITRGQVPLNEYNDLWAEVREGKIWKSELQYNMKDGARVWLSVTISPVFDEQNQITNFVGILEEITERKTAEENLRKAKEQAEKSDYLKSAFLANMSHEIRTPMNAILGFSSLLKEEGIDKEQSNYYIDIINSKGRDLLRIISDIIDISRIEAGDLYIKMEPVEIYPFIRDVYHEFREDSKVRTRSNLQFRLDLPEPGKKVIVNTDPSRLKQVFVNLIENALKFTPDGFIEMGFELVAKDNLRFFVRDSGIGIPEDKRKIIFERFRQIDDSHTREYGGTGLGLAICKNLLELMGSELSLQSIEGQGSEFIFPMKYVLADGPLAVEKAEVSYPDKPALDLKGKKILIVEDDGSSYLFLETLLNRFSPEILWAKSGKQAVSMVSRRKDIDLILMDIRMPEMDGIEATRRIRKKYPDIPIIAQTAYAQVTDRKLALESGCSDYLAKPIAPEDLTCLLMKYLMQ